jgi:hypothetical protein
VRNSYLHDVAFTNEDQAAHGQELQARYWHGGNSQKSIFSAERTASKHRASLGTSVARGNFAERLFRAIFASSKNLPLQAVVK